MMAAPRWDTNSHARADAKADADADADADSVVCEGVARAGRRAYRARGQRFELADCYRPLRVIGAGVYGVVLSARDERSGRCVAVKKIDGVFDDLVDAKRILREVRLMRVLCHQNILSVCDMEDPESLQFNDIYIYSPLYDNDLAEVITLGVDLRPDHVKYFVYQMLCALKYIHSGSVLHRDMKPANCLVTTDCDLALCDFGLARYVDTADGVGKCMTEYVVTRWYRPPELVLSDMYSSAVDMWGVGCIFAQLLERRPLFPGRDFKNQVEIICSVIGKPTKDQMVHIESRRARSFIERLPDVPPLPFKKRFPDLDANGVDLLERLLTFSPTERITAAQALDHPYLEDYHDDEFEPTVDDDYRPVDLEPRREDGQPLTRDDIASLLLREIAHFRPEAASLIKSLP